MGRKKRADKVVGCDKMSLGVRRQGICPLGRI
jgi:hypothetical protein